MRSFSFIGQISLQLILFMFFFNFLVNPTIFFPSSFKECRTSMWERHNDCLPPPHALTRARDGSCNQSTCSWPKLSPRPFSSQANAPVIEPSWLGFFNLFLKLNIEYYSLPSIDLRTSCTLIHFTIIMILWGKLQVFLIFFMKKLKQNDKIFFSSLHS